MTTALKYAVEPAGMARLTVDISDQVSYLPKNELELAASTDAHGTVSGRLFGLSIWHHGYKEVREEQEYFHVGLHLGWRQHSGCARHLLLLAAAHPDQ